MEKNSAEILREIEAALASLKDQFHALEEQVAQYKTLAAEEKAAAVEEPAPEEADFTDMEIGVADLPEAPSTDGAEILPEPAIRDLPEPEPAEMIDEDLPEPVVVEPAPEPVPEPVPQEKPAPGVPRADTERMPWRLDKPGLPVKNIRSGISLYDRALFIGTLFKEDYALYDKTIGDLNTMASLDEAVDYLTAQFPDWNLKSDIVYNFIRAIRKKLG